MFYKLVVFVLLSVVILESSWAANILCIYPTASFSHQIVFRALTKDLVARGHNLTVITTDPMKINNPNLTEIDFSFYYKDFHEMLNFVQVKTDKMDEYFFYKIFIPLCEKIYELQLNQPEVKKLIQNEDNLKFDLVIVEYLNYIPWYAFSKLFNVPLIGFTSLDAMILSHEDVGNVFNPIIHPDFMMSELHPPLNMKERWRALKYYLYSKFVYMPQFDAIGQRVLDKYFPNLKTTPDELRNSVQLLFTNTHPAFGFVRPIVPTTIQLGFMHSNDQTKPLPKDIKEFFDNSKNGVIYMSLGSNVKSSDLSESILEIFRNVFKSLKYDVLWKFENEELTNKPENVMIAKWLPQQDVLAHPKLKLFITQGGQQSTEEAIDRTVPMVVIPFIFDQQAIARNVEQRDIGVSVDLYTLSEKSLRSAIEEVLKPKYKTNVENLRQLVYDQPMTSREKAVWWVEYVIRHNGTKHLDYIGRQIPFYQIYCLDFLLIGLSICISFLIICRIIFNLTLKLLFKREKIKKS